MLPHTVRQTQDLPASVSSSAQPAVPPLLCFSHLRWDFVYQRPQHLMSRFADSRRVYFVEEPVYRDGPARFDMTVRDHGVRVVVPYLPPNLVPDVADTMLAHLCAAFLATEQITTFVAWYYTPMAMGWTRHLVPAVVIYDCMHELSLFQGAPAEIGEREQELMRRADAVFTGGTSLYEAKRTQHNNVQCFPSSVDRDHFSPARTHLADPDDQVDIPHIRLGFVGVIDSRMDVALLDEIAAARPEWQLILAGPVVKIDAARLPRRSNIHYLGIKSYRDLPAYMAAWDVAIMPFAMNEVTRFISPSQPLEYLAAGRPVVSTPIRDVVRLYGMAELVQVAETADEFCEAVEHIVTRSPEERERWLMRVDGFLSTTSWNRTYAQMSSLVAHLYAEWREAATTTSRATWLPPVATTAGFDVACGV